MKLIYILPAALLFSCCGGEEKKDPSASSGTEKEASQVDVCACIQLYEAKTNYQSLLESEGATPGEAMDKGNEQFKKEMEECESIHSSVGDEKFYEMSKECK